MTEETITVDLSESAVLKGLNKSIKRASQELDKLALVRDRYQNDAEFRRHCDIAQEIAQELEDASFYF